MLSVTDEALSSQETKRLRDAGFSYGEVGATQSETLPGNYDHLRRVRILGTGADRFEQAASILMSWDMHRKAGLRVRTSNEHAVTGAVAVLLLGRGSLSLKAPVRVVYVIDEPHRKGFAYGTLPGHPESGEEAFIVELRTDTTVTFTITAFSRPHTLLARLGGAVSRAFQSRVTTQYLRAL